MGRAPCCDKDNVKKGPWAPEEDAKLKAYIEEHGTGGNWIALPQKIGLKRCGKSCRLRWLNYLRPNIKHGGFSDEEDRIICSLYISIGSRWSIIAAQLPGRTDNDIKNYWNTRLKKKLLGAGKQRKEEIYGRKRELLMKKARSTSSDINIPSSIVVSGNQDPAYWPEMPVMPPVPYSNNQEPCFVNDHASIRKLLIKLGGRFTNSDHDNGSQSTNNIVDSHFPIDPSIDLQESSQDHDQKLINAISTPLSSSSSSMLLNSQYNMIIFPSEEMSYSTNNPHKLYGLEFLYGCDLNASGSSSSVITCGDHSMDWGEMNSLISSSTITGNHLDYQRSIQQEVLLEDCSYDEDINNRTWIEVCVTSSKLSNLITPAVCSLPSRSRCSCSVPIVALLQSRRPSPDFLKWNPESSSPVPCAIVSTIAVVTLLRTPNCRRLLPAQRLPTPVRSPCSAPADAASISPAPVNCRRRLHLSSIRAPISQTADVWATSSSAELCRCGPQTADVLTLKKQTEPKFV
ncbi:hypothetical protein LXL04_031424 [Taraxacum kok-saghyz]